MSTVDVSKLADQIIAGRRLQRGEDLSFFLDCDLEALCQGADKIRRAFIGDRVDLCTIVNGKGGRCSENCKFCAQSRHNHTGCEVHDMLTPEELLPIALAHESEGVHRFSIVNAGHSPTKAEFANAITAYKLMREKCQIDLCASLGFLKSEQFRALKEAGVSNYHNNIETSRRNFPNICTTHSYEDKIANIRRAQAEGLEVCSGGIIGMGETWEDRLDMAISLAELNIMSIPLNSLMPIAGTPLGHLPRLSEEDILRTIAFFRYINPEANIRLAAGRALMEASGKTAFNSGASATITGNMLTTSGSTIASDKAMLKSMGRDIVPPWQKPAETAIVEVAG